MQNVGNLTEYGGLSAAFDGSTRAKSQMFCAGLLISSTVGCTVGKQWIVEPQPVPADAETQGVLATRFVVVAPSDTAFVGQDVVTELRFEGSNDYLEWTTIYESTIEGSLGEVIDVSGQSNLGDDYFHFHRISIVGDGTNPCAVSQFQIYGRFAAGSTTVPPWGETVAIYLLTEDFERLETEDGDFLILEVGEEFSVQS